MDDTVKEGLDWSAVIGTLAYLIDYFWGVLPHLIALVSGIASAVWMVLRAIEQARNMGYLKGRKVRTRKDDQDDYEL